jgi:hypothetical protein
MISHRSLCFALAAAACGAPRVAPTPQPAAPLAAGACDLPAGFLAPRESLSVSVPGLVDPAHAPVPTTTGERVLFRQLYETLVRVDCEGRLLPALATRWTSADGGHTWTLILADSARFWDGVPVAARDVIAAWGPAVAAVADSVVPAGERAVTVRLRVAAPAGPVALADPALAVAKRVPGLAWPIGTGRYGVWGGTAGGDLGVTPLPGERLPAIHWRAGGGGGAGAGAGAGGDGGDTRDLLDGGVGLVVTDDAGALAYVASRAEFAAVPLPWDRTYVLLVPTPPAMQIAVPILEDLAGRAVRVEARPALSPYWWQDLAAGPVASPPATIGQAIVFPQGDPVARDLAYRLVALSPDGRPRRAVPMISDAFAAQLASGGGNWFVIAVPRLALDAGAAWRDLTRSAPWLVPAGVVALVDVRRRALIRGGAAGLSVDWDGVPRIR